MNDDTNEETVRNNNEVPDEPAKKKQKMWETMKSDRPFTSLPAQSLAFIKKTIDGKIFAYAKFLMNDKDVEAGYLQLVFLDLKWNTNSADHHVKRARSWKYLVDFIIKRCADRRAAAIAAIKKACVGKRVVNTRCVICRYYLGLIEYYFSIMQNSSIAHQRRMFQVIQNSWRPTRNVLDKRRVGAECRKKIRRTFTGFFPV